jgi:hypothetical protein
VKKQNKMKIYGIHNTIPKAQTINECLRGQSALCSAHSNGKPVVFLTTTNINARFATDPLLQFQIKHPVKTLPSISQTPFVDLALHPEKLEAALQTAKNENDAFAASRTFGVSATRLATPNALSQTNRARKSYKHSCFELVKTEFKLEAPLAVSVKLVADFTDWEKYPLDMVKAEGGVWSIFVPLSPGVYAYRFIVDGEWCDDPHSGLYESNPFGTTNALVEVT